MKLCDEAAGIAAVKHCRRRVVTAAIDRMAFLHPVHVGQLLTCKATVNAVWRTSMEVGVRVEAENPMTGEVRHTSTAYLTMVVVDEHGEPTEAPPLLAESPERSPVNIRPVRLAPCAAGARPTMTSLARGFSTRRHCDHDLLPATSSSTS